MRDLKSNFDAAQSIKPAGARTASVNGEEVDLLEYGSALVLVNLGDWTDGSFSFKVQERELTSDAWADVDAEDLVGAFTVVDGADDDNTVQRVSYIGDKRRIRVVASEAGGSPAPGTGLVFDALVVRGNPTMAPLA